MATAFAYAAPGASYARDMENLTTSQKFRRSRASPALHQWNSIPGPASCMSDAYVSGERVGYMSCSPWVAAGANANANNSMNSEKLPYPAYSEAQTMPADELFASFLAQSDAQLGEHLEPFSSHFLDSPPAADLVVSSVRANGAAASRAKGEGKGSDSAAATEGWKDRGKGDSMMETMEQGDQLKACQKPIEEDKASIAQEEAKRKVIKIIILQSTV